MKQDESKKEIIRYISMTALLVPTLLLSILFVRLIIGDVKQTRLVEEAVLKDQQNLKRRLNLVLYLLESRETKIVASEETGKTVYSLKPIRGEFDLQGIHKIAFGLKQKYPEVFRAIVNVTDKITEKEIKNVLKKLRKKEKQDSDLYLVDDSTGKKVKIKVMFSDVVLTHQEKLDQVEG